MTTQSLYTPDGWMFHHQKPNYLTGHKNLKFLTFPKYYT